jgi:ketosteroid isomerase-like protein
MADCTTRESEGASSDNDARRINNLALVKKFFHPELTSEDWIDMFAPDGVKEVPYALPDMTFKWDGRDQLEESRRINARRTWTHTEHSNVEIFPTTDQDVFFALSHMDARLGERQYVQNYVHMFRFRDGKISLYREWFDPLQLLDTRGGQIVFAEGDKFANP